LFLLFKIRFSNDRRERVYSASTSDDLNLQRTNPNYLSRYRNSSWFRCRTSSASSISADEYHSSSSSAYARLKRFTQRLLDLERRSCREYSFSIKCNPKISPKTAQPTVKPVRRRSYPQTAASRTSSLCPIRRMKSVSTMNVFPIENQTRPSTLRPAFPLPNQDKQISIEVKKNTFNRKTQVKTKQEDSICTTKKPLSPTIVTRVISSSTQPPISPHRISVVRQERRSSSKTKISFLCKISSRLVFSFE